MTLLPESKNKITDILNTFTVEIIKRDIESQSNYNYKEALETKSDTLIEFIYFLIQQGIFIKDGFDKFEQLLNEEHFEIFSPLYLLLCKANFLDMDSIFCTLIEGSQQNQLQGHNLSHSTDLLSNDNLSNFMCAINTDLIGAIKFLNMNRLLESENINLLFGYPHYAPCLIQLLIAASSMQVQLNRLINEKYSAVNQLVSCHDILNALLIEWVHEGFEKILHYKERLETKSASFINSIDLADKPELLSEKDRSKNLEKLNNILYTEQLNKFGLFTPENLERMTEDRWFMLGAFEAEGLFSPQKAQENFKIIIDSHPDFSHYIEKLSGLEGNKAQEYFNKLQVYSNFLGDIYWEINEYFSNPNVNWDDALRVILQCCDENSNDYKAAAREIKIWFYEEYLSNRAGNHNQSMFPATIEESKKNLHHILNTILAEWMCQGSEKILQYLLQDIEKIATKSHLIIESIHILAHKQLFYRKSGFNNFKRLLNDKESETLAELCLLLSQANILDTQTFSYILDYPDRQKLLRGLKTLNLANLLTNEKRWSDFHGRSLDLDDELMDAIELLNNDQLLEAPILNMLFELRLFAAPSLSLIELKKANLISEPNRIRLQEFLSEEDPFISFDSVAIELKKIREKNMLNQHNFELIMQEENDKYLNFNYFIKLNKRSLLTQKNFECMKLEPDLFRMLDIKTLFNTDRAQENFNKLVNSHNDFIYTTRRLSLGLCGPETQTLFDRLKAHERLWSNIIIDVDDQIERVPDDVNWVDVLTKILNLCDEYSQNNDQAILAINTYILHDLLGENPQVVINDSQSTHTPSVELFTKITAWMLKAKYENVSIDDAFTLLDQWVKQLETHRNAVAIRTCFDFFKKKGTQLILKLCTDHKNTMLTAMNSEFASGRPELISYLDRLKSEIFVEELLGESETEITLSEFIALIVTELQEQINEENIPEENLINTFGDIFYEIQRGNNLDANGIDQIYSKDSMICMGGAFNKFCEMLSGTSPLINFVFINKGTIQTRLNQVIQEHILDSLNVSYCTNPQSFKEDMVHHP